MKTRLLSVLRATRLVGLGAGAAIACGARTPLLPDDLAGDVTGDAGLEGAPPQDAAREADAEGGPRIDSCPDAAATLIYVFGSSSTLYSFDPSTKSFATIGTISCPGSGAPNSMAVDRQGVAYVGFETGAIYRVSTRTAECTPTAYNPAAVDDATFGMGFVADATGTETLFLALQGKGPDRLASVSTTTFALHEVGKFQPEFGNVELTGTGDGRLFAFASAEDGGSIIAEVDPETAQVLGEDPLPEVQQGNAFAFGFWGGAFYTFTAPVSTTVVQRFDPASGDVTTITAIDDQIVGAGVSTCAPVE
jgi:hypothetical protein